MSVSIEMYCHVEEVSEAESDQLEQWALQALPDILSSPGHGTRDLETLKKVEISIVSDETISEVHEEFLRDPSPTDVITFQHGEILVSYDTAKSAAASHSHSALDELFLYVIHGLLHLNGHLDHETTEHDEMHCVQNRIWARVLGR